MSVRLQWHKALQESRLDAAHMRDLEDLVLVTALHVVDEDWTGQLGRLLDLSSILQRAFVLSCRSD